MRENTYYTIPTEELGIQLEVFKRYYDIAGMKFCLDEAVDLLPENERICRFCFRTSPEVTFESKAHVIPHQLGNEHFISDFECDACNKKYAAFENDLSNFLGMTKTILQTKGKNGIPNFHSPQDIVKAQRVNLFNSDKGISIKRKSNDDGSIIVDDKTGTTTISYRKNPYKPFNVYKVLLKIALSSLDGKEVHNYLEVLKLLNDKQQVERLKQFAKVFKTGLSFERSVSNPFVLIFKKKKPTLDVPTNCVMVYFGNMIFQYFIPLHKEDMRFYNTGVQFHYCPPLSPLEFTEHDFNYSRLLDLSSSELEKDDGETLTMKANMEDIENQMKFDPLTGNVSKPTIDEIKDRKIQGIVLVPKNFIIPNEKLKKGFDPF